MFSDVANTKQSAIADIRGAILGLLLILATVIILLTINRQIVDSNITIDSSMIREFERSVLEPPIVAQERVNELCNNVGPGDDGVRCSEFSCLPRYRQNTCREVCNEIEGNIFVPNRFAGGTCYYPEANSEFIEQQEEQAERDREILEEQGITDPSLVARAFIIEDGVPNSFQADRESEVLRDRSAEDVLFYAQPDVRDYRDFEGDIDETIYDLSFQVECRDAGGNFYRAGGGSSVPRFYCLRR